MKNKIANFLKLGTLLLGISFLLYNCEDEKIEPLKQENLEGRFKFTLTQKKAVNAEVFSKLKIPITKTLSKNTSERNVNANLTVLTDYYSKIESNTYSTYAFEIAGATINQYQNLTVIKKEDTPLEYYLVSYIKDENSTNEFPYNVTYQVLDANLNLIDTSLLEKTTDFSINEETVNSSQKCYRLRFLPCGCRGKADGHSPTPGYSCCEGSPAMLVQTSCLDSGLCGGLPCPVPVGDPCNDCSDNPNGPGGTTPSNGGNSSGGGAGSPAPTSNHYGSNICFSDGTCTAGLYIPSISTRRIEDILKLTAIESNWLNSIENIGVKQLTIKTLNENNNSTEAISFAKQAIALERTLEKPLQVKQTGSNPQELNDCCPGSCCPNESFYDNDKIIKEYGVQPIQVSVDGAFNLLSSTINLVASEKWVGEKVRRIMTEIGMDVPTDVTNEHLAAIFKIRKRNGLVIVEYKEGILKEMLDLGLNSLDIISFLSPSKGGGAFLASKIGGISITKMTQHLRKISINNTKIDNAINSIKNNATFNLSGTGTYNTVNGHHPLAKSAFKGDKFYKWKEAFTVSASKLQEVWKNANPNSPPIIVHNKITGQQLSLYKNFSKKGEVLTLDKIAEFEIKAMSNVGIPKDIATGWVIKALEGLKTQGVKVITHIPWGGVN